MNYGNNTKIHANGRPVIDKGRPRPKRARKSLTPSEVSKLQDAYADAASRICDSNETVRRGETMCGRIRVLWYSMSIGYGYIYVIARGEYGGDHLLRVRTDRRGKPISILLCMVTPMGLSALRAVVDVIEEV